MSLPQGIPVIKVGVWKFTELGINTTIRGESASRGNHQLPESTETHVHRVNDAIQLSHPLSSPSPALNLSQNQGRFQ